MNEQSKAVIRKLPTGVPGLDRALGGGLPEYSFNLIAGEPGSGKTTLAQQIMFANATQERGALYFTVLGEPPIKMLRYQQQFSFFDAGKVDESVHFLNLSQEVLAGDLNAVLERIVAEVEARDPGIVVVDSFRTVVRSTDDRANGEASLQSFVQRLALHLTTWQATTFLVGEYLSDERLDNPVFTVADGLLWLSQEVDRNSTVRKLQVIKTRGQAQMPGLHTFRITGNGLQVFPRMLDRVEPVDEPPVQRGERLSMGVAELDGMMGGGIPVGDSVLLAGPTGAGKTTLANQFVGEGIRRGEPAVIAVFEEHPREYLARADRLGVGLVEADRQGTLEMIYLRPLDLSVDETLQELRDAVVRTGARRLVIDSLSGFEVALAPSFRVDFRESLYRMVGALTGSGVTVLMTVEVSDAFTVLSFSPNGISFLTDNIVLQRYVELDSELCKVISVVKMRGSNHSKELRKYDLTEKGLVMNGPLTEYQGIIGGMPRRRSELGGSPRFGRAATPNPEKE